LQKGAGLTYCRCMTQIGRPRPKLAPSISCIHSGQSNVMQ
jgi:hypothetical protein